MRGDIGPREPKGDDQAGSRAQTHPERRQAGVLASFAVGSGAREARHGHCNFRVASRHRIVVVSRPASSTGAKARRLFCVATT